MSPSLDPPLDPVEVRVLGALVEKEITTPEYYPLSLNALTNACNQKSNRDPVMELSDNEVRETLERLRARGLSFVRTGAGSRVEKFGHRLQEQFNFGRGELAVLDVLLLRGPQTTGELRTRTERMHRYDDLEQVERDLRALANWNGRELVRQLPLEPGSREPRWAHLLAGEPALARPATATARPDRLSELEQEVARLGEELRSLREEFDRFRTQF